MPEVQDVEPALIVPTKPGRKLDRSKFSAFALKLIDERGLTDPEEPEVLFIGIFDRFHQNLLEELLHAEIEFGRIDLLYRDLKQCVERIDRMEKRFERTTDKILRRSNASIAINYLLPFLYVLFGIALCFALQKALGRL